MQSDDQLQINTPEQIALELPLAGIGSRFLGLAIDTLLQIALYVTGTFAFIFVGAFLGAVGIGRYLQWIPVSWAPAIGILLVFCVYWGYFAFFEIIWKGQTPGKRMAKIRVIKESGRPINAYEAIARNLLRAVDGLPGMYGVGIVCMILNSQNRRLGDYVAGTVVVHDKATEEIKPEWNTITEPVATNSQLALVTSEELVLIETYLHRRAEMDLVLRDQVAYKIASRIMEKTGLQREANQSLDDFLEVSARQIRDTAAFR
ncbi:MAG: domain containing protein [Acidobacteriaceae bacterium]|nr:domain containing protein [Acidobacteriaceae bacterium]